MFEVNELFVALVEIQVFTVPFLVRELYALVVVVRVLALRVIQLVNLKADFKFKVYKSYILERLFSKLHSSLVPGFLVP